MSPGRAATSRKFSVVMATLNSARTIEAALKSLRDQDYPQDEVEVLVVDGGSTDATRDIAARYGCRVVDNPQVDPVNAKLIGMREATGDFLMHLDSDEVLTCKDALSKRLKAFQENPDVVAVFASGYSNPPGVPFAARYINEFGDPFSMFFYRLSKDARFLIPALKRDLEVVSECAEYLVFRLGTGPQPIMENAACGNCIDLEFFRSRLSGLSDKPWGPVHFFYHMQKFTRDFVVIKDDPILHYSAEHFSNFLRKIKSRVRNNLFFRADQGAAGFEGRVEFESGFRRFKKYLYMPYAFLVAPALLDSLYLMCTRRDPTYWLHLPLTLYTAGIIAGMRLAKALGYKPERKSYGELRVIPARAESGHTGVRDKTH